MDLIPESLRMYVGQLESIIDNAEKAKSLLTEITYMQVDYRKGHASHDDAIQLINEAAEFINK